jgi:hypothetical protein
MMRKPLVIMVCLESILILLSVRMAKSSDTTLLRWDAFYGVLTV